MGLSGTFVYGPAGASMPGTVEADLPHGWRKFFDDELHFAASDHAIVLSRTGPVLVGCVVTGDYCEIAGAVDGQLVWRWQFGQAPFPAAIRALIPSEVDAAACAELAAAWATRAGLPQPDKANLITVFHQGLVPVDAAIRAVGATFGLEEPLPAPKPYWGATNTRPPGPDYRDDGRRSWWLRVNIRGDLYEQLGELAEWLSEARELLVKPLIASYPPDHVRVSVDPHEQLSGEPGGLIVTSGGWSRKNRPVFGAGDDAGWTRKVRQLTKSELREIHTRAVSLGPRGLSWPGGGSLTVEAVIRDQFVAEVEAPLPPEHPAYLRVGVSHALAAARLPEIDLATLLTERGRAACTAFQAESAFVELARPLYYPSDERVPLSATAWQSGLPDQPGDP